MRLPIVLTLVLFQPAAGRQPDPKLELPKTPEPRFGIPTKLKAFPQETARQTLQSAIDAIEKPDVAYFLAHLLDPAFVELRLADRGAQYEAAVELELVRLRDFQRANADRVAPEDRVPTDRAQFRAMVAEKSRDRAFKQLARDVAEKLANDPQTLRDLKQILREGAFADDAGGARAAHPMIKDRAVYFRKIGDRWFIENRQEDAAPKKEP